MVLSRWYLYGFLSIVLISCKAKKSLPEGAPVVIKQKELLQKIEQAGANFKNIRARATGNLTTDGQTQNFRLEYRILKDSIIWVELADPVLGLKLARGLITRDSLFMINRIDREYYKGDIGDLQENFGVNYGFKELQNALSGNLVEPTDRSYKLYYVPGSYLLSTADPQRLEKDVEHTDTTIIRQLFIDPVEYKAKKQIQFDPVRSEEYQLVYQSFENTPGGMIYPQIIELIYGAAGENKLRIAVKKIDQDQAQLRYPFNIPKGYVEMR